MNIKPVGQVGEVKMNLAVEKKLEISVFLYDYMIDEYKFFRVFKLDKFISVNLNYIII